MNSNNQNFANILLLALLTLILPIMHQAQSSSESVYSDQAFDPPEVLQWYQDPFLWGAALLGAVAAYFWWKRRK